MKAEDGGKQVSLKSVRAELGLSALAGYMELGDNGWGLLGPGLGVTRFPWVQVSTRVCVGPPAAAGTVSSSLAALDPARLRLPP